MTSLIGGQRVKKCDDRVEAYGTVDELSAFIGVLHDALPDFEEETYIHSDGAKMYEIFNAAGVIMRVACAVHVRRPLWKLKETSDDAARVVYLLDNVFRKERTWNDEEDMTNEKRRQRSCEEVYPILHEIKNILDRMEKELDKERASPM